MNPEVRFTYNLEGSQKTEWTNFLKAQGQFSRYQHPEWVALKKAPGKACFFMFYQNSQLLGVSIVIENKLAANIDFGPVCISGGIYSQCIEHIVAYYKKKKVFALLRVVQPYKLSSRSEKIEYAIFQKNRFFQNINGNNWASTGIDLSKKTEDIEANFSKNHKRSIKKAVNSGTSIKNISTKEQVEEFSKVFSEMWSSRNLPNHFHSNEKLWAILKFFKENNQGTMMGIYDQNNVMIGGVIIFYEGNRLYYDSGASNPRYRKIPMMHRLIHEMIKFGKENGFAFFDFGGYDLVAAEKDQTKHINRFKDGFGGELLIYPKQMNFVLNPIIYLPFKLALWIRDKLS
jgi:hypothetical protein